MEYGDMSINGKNPEKTVAGMHSIIFNLIKELTHLEDENMIITECNVQCKFIEGPGIQEYEQYEDGDRSIIIDKTSLDKAKEIIAQQKLCRPLIAMLEEYGNEEARWITENQFNEFSIKFTNQYNSIFGPLADFDPDDSGQDYYDAFDINEILKDHNITFKIRHIKVSSGYQYAITKLL